MGRKRIGPRQCVYLCLAGLICFSPAGCSWKKPAGETPQVSAPDVKPEMQAGTETQAPPPQVSAPGMKPEMQARTETQAPPPQVSAPGMKPGMQARTETQAPPPAAARPSPALPESRGVKAAAEQLRRAKKLLAHKDFEASFKSNQRVLALAGKQPPADEALFNMGMIYILSENPKRDPGKSTLYFQRLVKEFPESFLAQEAKAWVGILQENEKLRDMIEKAKQVDITVDEKKREIAR